MRQTTYKDGQDTAGPLTDAGPYDYDLPAVRAGSPPAPVKRSALKSTVGILSEIFGLLVILIFAPWFRELTGWRLIDTYVALYGALSVIQYWTKPQPKERFRRWFLKTAGLWLNGYVALITVPLSLRDLLPEPLAFGLPAFLIISILYKVVPDKPGTGQKWQFWQWLVFALCMALSWGVCGPFLVAK